MICNNNRIAFDSCWDRDSIYFYFQVEHANLNYSKPTTWDLYQAKEYLKVLWNSDCIEIGFDLLHNRSEWKQLDDFEFIVDVKGNTIGNQWSVIDSVYNTWGKNARTNVLPAGTINNNQDMDDGFTLELAIPWSEFNFHPKEGVELGFDIQLYDKDSDFDDAFRTSLCGTNPESNDNTSEWATLILEQKPVQSGKYIAGGLAILTCFCVYYMLVRKKGKQSDVPAEESVDVPVSYSSYTETALSFIAAHYQEIDLSREQIADRVALTEKYLSSLFKKEVGVNLVSYINRYRIKKSIELLKRTRMTISQIAFKVGYNFLQNFNKNFKSVTGKTPTEFRR